MRDGKFPMLTTATAEGDLYAHPMTTQQVTDDAEVYFFLAKDSEQFESLKTSKKANLSFTDSKSWLSVAGTAYFLEGEERKQKIEELWDGSLDSIFSGKDDEKLEVVRIDGDSAQFWGEPGAALPAMLKLAVSKVTNSDPTEGGEDTTEL